MYRLTPEQQQIVQRIADVSDQSVAPHAARVDREGVFPRESIAALGAQGLLGLTVPPAFGGMGQGLGVMAAVLDEVARRCASTAMVYLMHLCGVACYAAAADKTAPQLRGRRTRAAPQHAGLQREGIAQPLLGAGQPCEVRQRRRVAQRAEVVRDLGRPGRRLRRLDAASRRDAADREHDLPGASRTMPASAVPGAWGGLGMRGNASAPMTLDERRRSAATAPSPRPARGST